MAFLPQPFQQDLKHSNQSSFISCRINKGRPFLCWNDARQKPCDKIGWKRIPLLNRNFSLQKSVPFGLGVLVKKIKTWNDCNTFLKFMIVDRRKKQHNMGTENSKSHKARSLTILVEFAILYILLANQSAFAADALKTCSCLLKECRPELARCIADPSCAANIACLQSCNDRPDETECQLKCGDLFENAVVDQFNECAVSRKKCVPKKPDEGVFPVPDPSVLVKRFNMADFSGKWYISSGLNPSFDTFDCQVHQFSLSQDRLTGNLSWRISTPDGGFITRTGVQRFVQDRSQPGILYNHDNEYLHYQDDWYILSSKTENKPDDYIFVYYRGRNDAWDGYGGAVVYTRSPVLPSNIVPDLENAARKVGLDFKKFKRTDNTCAPEPPLFARLEKKVEEGEQAIAKEVEVIEEEIEENVEKVERTEMSLLEKLQRGLKEIKKDEEYFLSNLNKEEKKLLGDLKMEAEEVEKLFGKSLPIRKVR